MCRGDCILPQAAASAVNSETLLIKQLPDTANQQYFMVLVVATVTSALDRLQLSKFLLPITQHMRLDAAELAYFANSEVALRGNGR